MVMPREDHTQLLTELLTPDLAHSRRTEIVTTLQGDYGTVLDDHSKQTESIEKLQRDNEDLVLANSKLFRQIAEPVAPPKDVEEKTFSQSVTISQLEQNALEK